MRCENCGNENVEIITKEIGYICPVCCRNTARMAELYGSDNYPEWVPVSERLPEEPKENPVFEGEKVELYLVTDMCKEYPVMALWNGKYFANGWRKMCVTAWMPMPEPYQESEE